MAESDEKRGFLPVSGVYYTWRVRNGAPELVDVKVGGKPLDLDHVYRIATNSYIAEQWDKHLGVEPKNLHDEGLTDFDASVAYARKGPIRVPQDARAEKVQ
jgi:2',3'-cyclic-nucleotide 2'-phosphodiesterase (5'-nucleotidase family)